MQTELGKLRTLARYTPLHRSAQDGETQAVIDLLVAGAEKDAVDAFGTTPLMHAAEEGHVSVAQTLLAHGSDVTVRNTSFGSTALHLAARGGHYRTVYALLSGGGDTDALDNEGETPLFDAAEHGHLPVVETLLDAGADVNVSGTLDGRTVLHFAAHGGRDEIVSALLSGGADKDAIDGDGDTPLIVAVDAGQLPVVETLLAAGANVNIRSACQGRTALHGAAIEGCDRTVAALLAAAANKDVLDPNKDVLDHGGDTPLIWAAEQGHLSVAKTLITAGADANISSATDGRTALHVTARRGHSEIADVLVSGGAGKDATDYLGCTPLMEAVKQGYLPVVNTLLAAGADPTIRSTDTGESALLIAIRREDLRVVTTLVDHGVDVNTRDGGNEHKFTPLHWACHHEVGDAMLDLLLWLGADETTENGDGETPAEKTTCERVRQLLTRASADKAWSCRGWLVMLRSCPSRVLVGCGDAGTRRVKRHRSWGLVAAVSNITGLLGVRWAAGGNGGDAVLAGVVGNLLELELDGVFRNVVSFL